MNGRYSLVIAITAFLSAVGAPGKATSQEKVQVEVCVLNDARKLVNGVRVHIAPLRKADPPMQTTNKETCLKFTIDSTNSFDVAFYNSDGEIIGVLRGFAGFENATVRVNHERLSLESKENGLLRLYGINAYTKTLATQKSVQKDVAVLLTGPAFKRQIETISTKLGSATPAAMREEIFTTVNKLRFEK